MFEMLKFLSLAPLLFATLVSAAENRAGVGHRLEVRIDPERGTIAARDRLDLPDGLRSWNFFLHQGLAPRITAGTARLKQIGASGHLEHWRLELSGTTQITLSYGGAIRHRLEDIREGMGRIRQGSIGIIAREGVVLDGPSGWYPRDPDAMQHFDLQVQLPDGWLAVSQGMGPEVSANGEGVAVRWREDRPQDDIYLVAARFERYAKVTPSAQAQVYLRRADPELAAAYLAATDRYLALYSRLIGPYPYAKLALVENFWDTGFGMPSFTLLGPRVIRLPFILHTSFPHEILHNWWGNGVYVDYQTGNWSEGLTAYLADHLFAEQSGGGAAYRRDSLRSYADYARAANDFPLRAFRDPHGTASQAIGYGKTLMVLHMLRCILGDETFVAALRRFYRENLFQKAGFDDLRGAMEKESGRGLEGFFRNWVGRPGAPVLSLSDVRVERKEKGLFLRGSLQQTQSEDPFPLQVPLILHLEGGEIREHRVSLTGRSADFELELPANPLRVDADPRFDLFRGLVPGESPITLSALFGSDVGMILLPGQESGRLAEGYRQLADGWRRGSSGWEVITDADIEDLPEDRPIWLLGWRNRFLGDLVAGQSLFHLDADRRLLHLPEGDFPGGDFGLALVWERAGRPLGWAASPIPQALPGLARKLPHYGGSSYLVFQGEAPDNRVKGQWPVRDSRLMVWMGDRRPSLTTPPHPPLTAVLEPRPERAAP